MNALVTIQRFVIVMSSKIALNCKIIPWLRLDNIFINFKAGQVQYTIRQNKSSAFVTL